MKTKWGTAKINKQGYYQIKSKKEGFYGKMLHRLIANEYFGEWINDANDFFDIHHLNHVKTDNCILNLMPIKRNDHISMHMKNKIFSLEYKKKLCENHADVSGKNHPMYGKNHSIETKNKIRKSLIKEYPRIVKCGFDRGKQKYGIKFNQKIIKQSISIDKLIKWFEKNYSNQKLYIEIGDG